MITFNVKEDTITEYIKNLQDNFKYSEKGMLEKLGHVLTSEISSVDNPPYDTGTLLNSGEEGDDWRFLREENMSKLEIVYSGLTNDSSWQEFSNDWLKNHPPDRDYAYFQETGIDAIASKEDARHKYFVRRGTEASKEAIGQKTAELVKELLNGKKISSSTL